MMEDPWESRLQEERLTKRYHGPFIGIVVDRDDPQQLQRVRLIVPEIGILTPNKTDWAFPSGAMSGVDTSGEVNVPENGSQIWVFFRMGDPDKPMYLGGFQGESVKQEGEAPSSDIPSLALGVVPTTMVGKQPADIDTYEDADGSTKTQKDNPFAGVYPDNHVFKLSRGLVVERDNTDAKNRIHLYHPIGTFDEMDYDGDRVAKTARDWWTTVGRNEDHHVIGTQNIKVDGKASIRYAEQKLKIDGNNTEEVLGAEERTVTGVANYEHLNSYLLTIKSQFIMDVTEQIQMATEEAMQLIAGSGISLNGGSGSQSGVVNQESKCSFTGAPHPDFSSNVTCTK